jgi:hypothetical protein
VPVSAKLSIHSFLTAFVLVLWLVSDPVLTLFVGGVCALVVYGTLTVIECLDSPGLITPFSYHFAWNAAALGLAAGYFGFVIWNSGWTRFDTIPYVTAKDLSVGYVLCIVASLLTHAVLRYFSPTEKAVTELKRVVPAMVGLVIFLAGAVVIVAPRGIVALSGLPAAVVRFSPLAVLLAVAFGPSERRFYWTKLFSGTAFLIAANLLAFFPYKGGVIQSLFPLMIALWRKSRRLALAVAVVVPLFYLGIVAPFVTASRNKTDLNPLERLSVINTEKSGTSRFDALMARLFEPIEAGYIVGETRFHGFLGGETMKNVEYALVPRFLWPEKPTMDSGKWFTSYLGFPELETSTAMTPAGELYWNFSVPGLVLGSALLCCLYGLLWRIAERFGKGTFFGALLYFFVILYPTSAGDASSMFILIPSLLILLLPFILWSRFKTAACWMFQPLMRPDHTALAAALRQTTKSGTAL